MFTEYIFALTLLVPEHAALAFCDIWKKIKHSRSFFEIKGVQKDKAVKNIFKKLKNVPLLK